MRFYVTKWVLTRGILVARAEPQQPPGAILPRITAFGHVIRVGSEAFRSLPAARDDARKQFEAALKTSRTQNAYFERAMERLDELLVHEHVTDVTTCRAFKEVHSGRAADVQPGRRPQKEGSRMPTSISADPTFGLNPQSLAVLHLMTGQYVNLEAPPKTYPWYNGRENGVSFVIQRGGIYRVIVVGEDSRSDGLFVEYWDQTEQPFNAPTIEQREGQLALVERLPLKAGAVAEAAERAVSLIQEFAKG